MFFRSDFQVLPFQATECCLAHVKPINGKPADVDIFFYIFLKPIGFIWPHSRIEATVNLLFVNL